MRHLIVIFLVIGVNSYGGVWVEKTHTDFADGWEYYYMDGDTVAIWDTSKLRKWELGSIIYSPVIGGLRIIGKDWDLDDNGWLDVILTWNSGNEVEIYWNGITGFNLSNKTVLSGLCLDPQAISLADINSDKYEDVMIGSFSSNYWPSKVHFFYGSSSGYSSTADDSITLGASEIQYPCPTDINNDGYVDLVIGALHRIYIYHGPPPFYGSAPADSLIFGGAVATRITIADLNYDGYLDISGSSSHNVGPLNIYWGPDFTTLTTLASESNWDHSVADLNKDGYLDIYVNHSNSGYDIIYWGSATGFTTSTNIPGNSSGDCSIEDIDGDGNLDIATTQLGSTSGYVMWGPTYSSYITLPTGSTSHGVEVADFDNDGDIDVLFASRGTPSYLYWNNAGFLPTNRFTFPNPCDDAVFEDLGNLWDRSNKERYLSSVVDLSDTICVNYVRWWGNFPPGVNVEVWMRGALDTNSWKPWVKLHNASYDTSLFQTRYLQYRCIFSTDYKLTSLFSFDSIKVYYDTFPVGVQVEPNLTGLDVRSYPNPIRVGPPHSAVFLQFSLPEDGIVNLTIYNLAGKKIKSLIVNTHYTQGLYTKFWDATDNYGEKVTVGVYIYTFEFIGERRVKEKITQKLIIL